jgi:hypothetical protein
VETIMTKRKKISNYLYQFLSVTWPVEIRPSNVQRTFCQFFMRCVCVLCGTNPLLARWSPLTVRCSSGICALIVRSLCVLYVLCAPYSDHESTEQQREMLFIIG